MLLENMSTMTTDKKLLLSGGEFFIKSIDSGGNALQIANGKQIDVNQPAALSGTKVEDTSAKGMRPFFAPPLTLTVGWNLLTQALLTYSLNSYIFSLYSLSSPVAAGSWCNSDNPYYFNAYPQMTLTLNPYDKISDYGTQVFLIFKNLNSMIHVYDIGTQFPYFYAPLGLQCTVVAFGVSSSGDVYSAFGPITISNNGTISFSLSKTTTADFKNQLSALN